MIDTLPYFEIHSIFATESWIEVHQITINPDKLFIVNRGELKEMSGLITTPDVIAVYHIPSYEFNPQSIETGLILALDDIQDPGNMGTIIRTADWFGVHHVLCSKGCVDIYNPKTVQSTMGAISRVKTYYGELKQMIMSLNTPNIYGTFLDGTSIYDTPLSTNGIIIMGNEGKGVSPEIAELVNKKLFIPSYPAGTVTSESLNVAVATAITLAEFRRNTK